MANSASENSRKWVGELQAVHVSEIPQKIQDVQDRLHQSIVRQCRQAITGDPDKRVRDNMDDKNVQTIIKEVDAWAFAMGVFLTMLVEYLALSKPEYLAPFTYSLMPILLIHRFFSYKEAKFHYFLIDFCYFLNLSTWMQILMCPNDDYSEECEIWFKSNFVMSICPISFAIIGWNCSLVFHSVDKVTSFMVHVLPGLICHLMRFDTRLQVAGLAQKNLGSLTLKEQFFYPLIFYVVWQLFQLFIQFTVIEKDQSLVTSLRYLAKDHKNPMTKFFTKLALFLGFIKHEEKASPYQVSIILMFTLFQFGYMVVLMIPTKLMFDYEFISAFYLIFIITYGIWLGASYYIQIFSQRYNSKFLTASNNNINNSLNNSSDKSD